jgi:hypothetical protein
MGNSPFTPSKEVQFDLGRGQISLGGRASRLLVPPEALLGLCQTAGSGAVRDFGRQLGAEVGGRVAERLGRADSASIAEVVEHLGGDVALSGLGSLSVERWGRALVLRVTDSPLGGAGDELLASVFEGALQRALGRDAAVVPIERKDGSVRLLATSTGAAARVRGWLASGVGFAEALGRLEAG